MNETMRQRAERIAADIKKYYKATAVTIAWDQSQIPAEYDVSLPGPHAIGFIVTLETDSDSMTVVVPIAKKPMMLEGNYENVLLTIGRSLRLLVAYRIEMMRRARERADAG